ncbi:hypothetical protein ACIBR1_03850 [Micromonospora echinaurantiaca]
MAAKKTAAARRTTAAAKKAPAKKAPAKKAPAAKKTTAARRTTAAAKKAPAKKAPAKKAPAAKKTTAATKTTAAKKTTAARPTATAAKKAPAARRTTAAARQLPAPTAGGGVRTGRSSSRSVTSSQVISSLADRPEHPGRSLVTSNHEVIQRWAQERGAKPATIAGTEREGRAGVLTFNIPGYRESSRIREITWDEWFHTFDLRKLNLIYQEQMRDGRQSNFFRTESPDREDA